MFRVIKGPVIVVFGLLIFITLMSLLIPSQIVTIRSVVVRDTPAHILAQVADLRNWQNWHPALKNNPVLFKAADTGGAVGSSLSWTANNKPIELVVDEVSDRYVVVRLHQKNENDVKNIIAVNDVQEINAYQVQWTAVIKLKWYPWEKFAGIFIEKMTGSGYELTLESLKNYLENTSLES